jgi:hypothetical protein
MMGLDSGLFAILLSPRILSIDVKSFQIYSTSAPIPNDTSFIPGIETLFDREF